MQSPLVAPRCVTVAENRSALAALRALAEAAVAGRCDEYRLVLIHGRSGSGKTYAVQAALGAFPQLTVVHMDAAEFTPSPAIDEVLETARQADLLVVEDLQHLPGSMAEAFSQLLDARNAQVRPTAVTACNGPAALARRGKDFPARLTSRLAEGLVVAMPPLGPDSRRAILADLLRERKLSVDSATVDWLAERLRSWRELHGAAPQLQVLADEGRLTPADVMTEFAMAKAEHEVARITELVGKRFEVTARQQRSAARARNIVLARQASMYLARRFTGLSLERIGSFFGGRDHATVLHACSKVERALADSGELQSVLRDLAEELV